MTRPPRFARLLLLALLVGCGSDSGTTVAAPSYLAAPGLAVAPDPFTPLAAEVVVSTDQPTTVEVEVRYADGDLAGVFPGSSAATGTATSFATTHRVGIFRLQPGKEHRVQVRIANEAGSVTPWEDELTFVAPELPLDLPPFEITIANQARMEPGYTLFNVFGTDSASVSLSHVCLFDVEGRLVWYHRSQQRLSALRRLRNGNLLVLFDNFGLRELDWTGRTVCEWWATALTDQPPPSGAIPVPIDTFHHEVFEMPESDPADFLVLSSDSHVVRNVPLDVVDQEERATTEIVSDVVHAIKRDGTVLESLDMIDLLDVGRLCYDSLGSYWANVYGPDSRDWTHGNAAIYDPLHDEVIVSLRHQEALVAFGRSDGELRWILGDHAGWQMPLALYLLDPPLDPWADFEWPFHQHAPVVTGLDSIMLFDNGNNRAIPPAAPQPGPNYSRAVEYRIDRNARTVEQLWDYGGPDDPWYSFAVGDANPLPLTNNVLVADGARMDSPPRWSRIFEVTRSGELVFELRIRSEPGEGAFTWLVYRAERIPNFP